METIHLETAARIAGVSSSSARPAERAAEVLDAFRSVVPFAAANILVARDFELGHELLVSDNYSDPLNIALASAQFHQEVYELGMMSSSFAMRMCDVPSGPESVEAVSDHLYPAGYCEGLTATLFSLTGRYVGLINLSTTDIRHPSDDARDLLLMLSAAVAHAIDPLTEIDQTLERLSPDASVAFVQPNGHPRPVAGRPLGLLADENLTTSISQRLMNGAGRWITQDADGQWHRLQAHASSSPSGGTLLSAEPNPDMLGLTRRELEVVNLLAAGMNNPDIAERLGIARRTVASHVESILAKLGLPNRAAAASVAVRHGLELI